MKLYRLTVFIISIILLSGQALLAQKLRGTISGQTTDKQHQPIENVSVLLKGTHYGATTDEDGNFSFRAPAGDYTLVISLISYQTLELPVSLRSGQTVHLKSISLSPVAGSLKEVRVNSNYNRFRTRKSNDVTKIPLDNLENPQVYATVGAGTMTEQQVFSVDDALKNVPGLQTMWNATGRSGDGGTYFNSRGFILQSTLRNGMAGSVTNTQDAANVDRIEVLKGPSATLFGSQLTSFGGVINRITKKPFDTVGGSVSYSAGSYNLNRLSADINTPLDKDKKVLFRLNTALNYTGSFQNNGFTQGVVIDPSLLYKINDRLSVSFDAELNYGKNSGKPIFFPAASPAVLGTDNAAGLALNYRASYSNDNLDQNTRNTNYYAGVNYKINNEWTSQTTLSATRSFSNGFYPYFYLLKRDTISRNDQSTRNSSEDVIEVQQNFNGDFRIGNMRNRFVGGLDYFHEHSNQLFFGGYFDKVATTLPVADYNNFNYPALQQIYNTAGGIQFNYPIVFSTNTYSAYTADVLNVTDRLLVLASLRLNYYDNKGGNTGGSATPVYTQTTLSPKFGLVYQLIEKQLSIFGNYQNGFINPGAYTAYNTATNTIGSQIAKVQNAEQLEGGIKLDLFEGKLSGTFSYYDIQLTNVLRTDPAHAAQYAQLQDGTQLSKGIEAEIAVNPFPGLNIMGGFSYNDSKYTKADADVLGRRPATASAPYTANWYASYRLPKNTVDGLGFGFGGNYASNNNIVNSNSQGVFYLPSFTVLNASAFYEQRKYRINLALNNLANKEYYTGYTTINPQMLRQLIVGLTWKF